MHNENYSIIFSSLTGNTRKLADKIHEILPKESCDYFGTADAQGTESELLYIGFWTDKGNADSDTLDFLSKLKNKKIFLFGTAGFGGSDAYFQRILGNVKSAIDSSDSGQNEGDHRRQQHRDRNLYVPGQNATVCAGALCENERKPGASG